jgi:hypothetical protein
MVSMRIALSKPAVAALCVIALSSLQGVSAQQTPPPKPPASVNLSALVAAAPFHDILAQYDREIATLRYIRASTSPDAKIALDKSRSALLNETDGADARIRAIDDRSLTRLRKHELAISENIRKSGDLSENHYVAGDVRIHALKQFSTARARADEDFARYRDDLASQKQNVLRKYELLLDSGMRRAYAAHAQILRERESLLVFNLAQKESGIRLQTHARLQNVAPDRDERARLRSTLQMLDHQDIATIREQQGKDAVELQHKHARQVAQTHAAYESMREHIEKTDEANLSERRRVAGAQTRDTVFPTIPKSAGEISSLPDKFREFAASDQAIPNGRRTFDAFDFSRNVLTTRFALLSSIDASAKNATNAQIALLLRERLDLRNEIAAFILRNAQYLADQRNLGKAFPSDQAPRGSIDITGEVKNNLKASLF